MFWDTLNKCCAPVPQRLVIATMVMSGLALQYIHRVAFNLVITEITFSQNVESKSSDELCPFNETETRQQEEHKRFAEFHWDSQDQAHLVGAFYIGYLISHIPAGVIADIYGPKKVLSFGVLLTALCTILTPTCARVDFRLLAALRLVMGIAQGPVFPCLSVFNAHWALPTERYLMSSYMSAGVTFGAIMGNAFTGVLLVHLSNWETVFYIYAVVTIPWFVMWVIFTHDHVQKHPFITEKERGVIHEALKAEVHEETKLKLPVVSIVKSAPVWAMVLINCGNDWAFYVIVSLLPQYMSYVLHVNVLENGLFNSLPYIFMFIISMLSAKIGEAVVTKGWLSQNFQCKLFASIANEGPCLMFILASYAGCNKVMVVFLFSLAMGVLGLIYPSARVVQVYMAPNFAGTLMALLNGAGSLTGFLGPELFAVFTQEHTLENWRKAFFISGGIVTVTTIIFLIWGTTKIQSWNFPPESSPSGDGEETANTNSTPA